MIHPLVPRLGSAAVMAALVAVALTLAGCGRKGPLELPPGAPQAQAPEAATAQQERVLGVDDPGLIQSPNAIVQPSAATKLKRADQNAPRPINAPPAPRKNTFVLDPLL